MIVFTRKCEKCGKKCNVSISNIGINEHESKELWDTKEAAFARFFKIHENCTTLGENSENKTERKEA